MDDKKFLICDSENIVFFANTSDKHYGWNDKFYDVYKCKNCKTSFLEPMITDDELFNLYPKDYYEQVVIESANSKVVEILKKINKSLIGFEASDILLYDFKGKKVLDIGVGDGDSLVKLKLKGANVSGVEIRKDACDRGNLKGLNITNGTLIDAKYPSDYFDYIRSNHSFEHLTNPIETLKEIHRTLKKNGQLFIGVPNNRGLISRVFGKNWYYLGVPFHPYNYNVKALSILLNKNGFSIRKIYYNGNFNGILGSIQILLNSKNKRKSSEGYFSNFFTRIIFHQLARLLNLLRVGDCIEILADKD